jgi:AraC-like DNA-binding protein
MPFPITRRSRRTRTAASNRGVLHLVKQGQNPLILRAPANDSCSATGNRTCERPFGQPENCGLHQVGYGVANTPPSLNNDGRWCIVRHGFTDFRTNPPLGGRVSRHRLERGSVRVPMILLDQAGAGISRSRLVQPPAGLKCFVEHFWVQNVSLDEFRRAWRIVPDASPYLILVVLRNGAGSTRIRCSLVGPRSRFADVSVADRIFTCGARLHPGALPLLTRLPASDFTDRSVPIPEVFGARSGSLMNQLGEATSASCGLGIMADFLSRQFAGHEGVQRLPRTPSNQVQGLAIQLGVSPRTLHACLKRDVGLSPKRLLRIGRLHRALAISQNPSVSWTQTAAFSGFADQAHMIREFQELLGESPTLWSSRSAPADLFKTTPRAAS